MHEVHPSNLIMLDGAVFDGPYEGLMRRRSAADWLRLHDYSPRAGGAVRQARDGAEGASFKALDGVVWHLRRADPVAS